MRGLEGKDRGGQKILAINQTLSHFSQVKLDSDANDQPVRRLRPACLNRGIYMGLFVFVGFLFIALATSGTRRMSELRGSVVPGLSALNLPVLLGSPVQTIHRGDSLQVAHRSYRLPELDPNATVYVFAKEGIPYFNIYVTVDDATQSVIRTDFENILW